LQSGDIVDRHVALRAFDRTDIGGVGAASGMTFVYFTGRGTDSTEQGNLMWARVKGKTENDLLKLPFKAAYMFRPAAIQPLHGVRSKTA
jgi:hypothetical protein